MPVESTQSGSRCCAFNLVGKKKVLLGRDLLATFGLEIRGIHLTFTTPNGAPNDDLSRFDDLDSVVTVYEEILAKIKQGILVKLSDNKKVARAELCTLSYAQVALETCSSPVNRRKYPIPHHLQDSVQKRISSWLETGTISLTPVESEWNSHSFLLLRKMKMVDTPNCACA